MYGVPCKPWSIDSSRQGVPKNAPPHISNHSCLFHQNQSIQTKDTAVFVKESQVDSMNLIKTSEIKWAPSTVKETCQEDSGGKIPIPVVRNLLWAGNWHGLSWGSQFIAFQFNCFLHSARAFNSRLGHFDTRLRKFLSQTLWNGYWCGAEVWLCIFLGCPL
jgi:hypothetical protein